MRDFAEDDDHYEALRKTKFIPITPDGEIDEFLLAVKYPKLPITRESLDEVLPTLEKYVKCKT